ncbi:MAG: response regulator [Deltaproteobacteria bacterium]|nr:response regulator [Deltaproteobacteria bacterium]
MAKKILSAEDSPATQKFISFTLKYKGYDVVTANDGIEALEKLGTESFDLIILDIMMPRMNGLEVLKEIKTKTPYKDIPILMLTSEKGDADRQKAMSLGATSFLTKPFQPPELIEAVSKALGV